MLYSENSLYKLFDSVLLSELSNMLAVTSITLCLC